MLEILVATDVMDLCFNIDLIWADCVVEFGVAGPEAGHNVPIKVYSIQPPSAAISMAYFNKTRDPPGSPTRFGYNQNYVLSHE